MPLQVLQSRIESSQGGVFFAPAMEARKVESLAKKSKFAFFHVDGRSVQRKEQLMNAMATALDLPEHFGHNWDALEECLAELDGIEAKGYVLLYDHIDGLLSSHPDQFETLVEIFRDAVAAWQEDGTAMIVVLSGAKAPPDVEKLKA
jgi:RNAse (barnase) inhibitor barstar